VRVLIAGMTSSPQPDPLVPDSLDRDLLQLYLNDHLAGATAGKSRAQRMAREYTDLPIHQDLVEFAADLDREHRRLSRLIDELGLGHHSARLIAGKVVEQLGRLKLNRRLFTRSPMTPLLELELARGAVNAKAGLWQELAVLSPALGLASDEWLELADRAKEQSVRLERMHAAIRGDAFNVEQT